jgi:hypothetical protein
VRFDGTYIFHDSSGLAAVKVKITFPPHVRSVFGISNPYEWAFDVTTTFNPTKNSGALEVHTAIGQSIEAQYVFLRSLSEAA